MNFFSNPFSSTVLNTITSVTSSRICPGKINPSFLYYFRFCCCDQSVSITTPRSTAFTGRAYLRRLFSGLETDWGIVCFGQSVFYRLIFHRRLVGGSRIDIVDGWPPVIPTRVVRNRTTSTPFADQFWTICIEFVKSTTNFDNPLAESCPKRPPKCRTAEIACTISEMHAVPPKLAGKTCSDG